MKVRGNFPQRPWGMQHEFFSLKLFFDSHVPESVTDLAAWLRNSLFSISVVFVDIPYAKTANR
jgi:hypothetical protein